MNDLTSKNGRLLLTVGKTARLGNVAAGVDNYDAVNLAQLNEALLTVGSVSDEAYNSTTWNGVTDVAPSKNAVRDMDVLVAHLAGTETLTGLKTFSSLLVASGRLGLPAGDSNNKAIYFGGAGTGIWRDNGLDGLKILINNVNVLWISDGSGVTVKNAFSTEGTVVNAGTPQTLTGAGAVNTDTYTTYVETTGTDALTLADGIEGQHKHILMTAYVGDATLTPTNLRNATTIVFNSVDDYVHLFFINGQWSVLTNSGCTIA